MNRPRIVAFLARQHGLAALEYLINKNLFDVQAVLTHRRNPKCEDPDRRERSDFPKFEKICLDNKIPLITVDGKKDAQLAEDFLSKNPCEAFLSISWRRLFSPDVLSLPLVGGINLHRGRLPDYAGAEPIKRALEAGEKEITIAGHVLVNEVDAGPVLANAHHPITPCLGSLKENVERLKEEITPLFGPLAEDCLQRLFAKKAPRNCK